MSPRPFCPRKANIPSCVHLFQSNRPIFSLEIWPYIVIGRDIWLVTRYSRPFYKSQHWLQFWHYRSLSPDTLNDVRTPKTNSGKKSPWILNFPLLCVGPPFGSFLPGSVTQRWLYLVTKKWLPQFFTPGLWSAVRSLVREFSMVPAYNQKVFIGMILRLSAFDSAQCHAFWDFWPAHPYCATTFLSESEFVCEMVTVLTLFRIPARAGQFDSGRLSCLIWGVRLWLLSPFENIPYYYSRTQMPWMAAFSRLKVEQNGRVWEGV